MDNGIIIAFIKEIPILIVGLTVAYYVHLLQNKAEVITRKAWIEGKQKLDIENTIEIINGINELRSALDELSYLVLRTGADMSLDFLKNKLTGKEVMRIAIENFSKDAIIENKKIDNFLFLLEKDIRINNKNKNDIIKEEIENIKEIKRKMNGYIMRKDVNELKYDDIKNIKEEIKSKFVKEEYGKMIMVREEDIEEMQALEVSINNILNIYVPKLNKEEKS